MKLIKILTFITSFLYVAYGNSQAITIPGSLLFIVSFIIVAVGTIKLVHTAFTDLTRYEYTVKK